MMAFFKRGAFEVKYPLRLKAGYLVDSNPLDSLLLMHL